MQRPIHLNTQKYHENTKFEAIIYMQWNYMVKREKYKRHNLNKKKPQRHN